MDFLLFIVRKLDSGAINRKIRAWRFNFTPSWFGQQCDGLLNALHVLRAFHFQQVGALGKPLCVSKNTAEKFQRLNGRVITRCPMGWHVTAPTHGAIIPTHGAMVPTHGAMGPWYQPMGPWYQPMEPWYQPMGPWLCAMGPWLCAMGPWKVTPKEKITYSTQASSAGSQHRSPPVTVKAAYIVIHPGGEETGESQMLRRLHAIRRPISERTLRRKEKPSTLRLTNEPIVPVFLVRLLFHPMKRVVDWLIEWAQFGACCRPQPLSPCLGHSFVWYALILWFLTVCHINYVEFRCVIFTGLIDSTLEKTIGKFRQTNVDPLYVQSEGKQTAHQLT